MEDDDYWGCTVCGDIGIVKTWRWVKCDACVDGEPIGPRMVHRLAEEHARARAKDPWYKSVHA